MVLSISIKEYTSLLLLHYGNFGWSRWVEIIRVPECIRLDTVMNYLISTHKHRDMDAPIYQQVENNLLWHTMCYCVLQLNTDLKNLHSKEYVRV